VTLCHAVQRQKFAAENVHNYAYRTLAVVDFEEYCIGLVVSICSCSVVYKKSPYFSRISSVHRTLEMSRMSWPIGPTCGWSFSVQLYTRLIMVRGRIAGYHLFAAAICHRTKDKQSVVRTLNFSPRTICSGQRHRAYLVKIKAWACG